jgi:hypothetical protein
MSDFCLAIIANSRNRRYFRLCIEQIFFAEKNITFPKTSILNFKKYIFRNLIELVAKIHIKLELQKTLP